MRHGRTNSPGRDVGEMRGVRFGRVTRRRRKRWIQLLCPAPHTAVGERAEILRQKS